MKQIVVVNNYTRIGLSNGFNLGQCTFLAMKILTSPYDRLNYWFVLFTLVSRLAWANANKATESDYGLISRFFGFMFENCLKVLLNVLSDRWGRVSSKLVALVLRKLKIHDALLMNQGRKRLERIVFVCFHQFKLSLHTKAYMDMKWHVMDTEFKAKALTRLSGLAISIL